MDCENEAKLKEIEKLHIAAAYVDNTAESEYSTAKKGSSK